MTPEEIRRLYASEDPATAEEAAESERKAQTDPEEARRFLETAHAMASEDITFAELFSRFMSARLIDLVKERAATDDAYALVCSRELIRIMHQMAERNKRTPRGRPREGKQTRSA